MKKVLKKRSDVAGILLAFAGSFMLLLIVGIASCVTADSSNQTEQGVKTTYSLADSSTVP